MAADRWYDTINVPDDIKSLLGLPVLGTIPLAGKNEVVDDLIADPRSRVAEAYHSTRTALQFAVSGGAPKSILFTSARPNEGKTSCAIALAADFRSVGRSVIVVDADLRKPSLQGESPGLTAVLAGASSQADAILSTPTPGLALLPAGRRPPNPTTLLNSRAMEELVRSLEREFDIVIIDGPPVMGFADAPLLAAIVEASVLVIEAGGTSRSVAKDAINRLQATGGVVAGAILTKFDYTASGMGAYGYEKYAYSYAYGGDTKKRALIGPPVTEEVDA
jgi:capsular exopolysaccharide synthesis family protein